LTKRIFGEIGALFAQGTFTPLPYRAFGFDEIGNAFRLMQNAGHIGKIVVLPPVPGRDRVAVQHANAVRVDAGGMHLVVGGIGGFGLAAAEWLVEKGARHIALCSRRGVADEETAHAIRRWKAAGVCAELFACDVTDEQAVADMLAEVRGKAPLRSVVHAAMVLDDALIANLDRARNRPVIDTKAKGAAILDRLTRQDALDNFILFSSATTLVGNPGQANYVAANGYLEGLARTRRREGLPALAVGFGAIADKGYLARNTDVNELLAKRIGRTALGARAALSAVEAYIASAPNTPEAATVMISEFDWNAVRSLQIAKGGLFELIMRSADSRPGGAEAGELDLVAMTEGKSPQEAEDILFEVIATEIAAVLHVPRESILRNQVLKEIGMDSLMAMEVGLSFQQNTGFDMPLSGLTDNTTVGDIARRLLEKVSKRDLSADADEEVEEVKIFNDLSQRHVGQEQAAAL
jgi:NAD(P)-dependent dehydrogenase (short-subunit alcohol dehydrogenase family)/acyl carrier protein